MNTLLQSLGNGKVPGLYSDSVIGLRRVLGYEEQIDCFLVDELVVTLDVLFIDVQAGSGSKKMLYLVRALKPFVWLKVMNWLEWAWIFSLHFVPLPGTGIARGNLCEENLLSGCRVFTHSMHSGDGWYSLFVQRIGDGVAGSAPGESVHGSNPLGRQTRDWRVWL